MRYVCVLTQHVLYVGISVLGILTHEWEPTWNKALNANFLLTEREVCTEKYRTEDFFVQTEPEGRGLHKKAGVRYFSLHMHRASEVNKKFIIWHL
jgi:hypothetical protein